MRFDAIEVVNGIAVIDAENVLFGMCVDARLRNLIQRFCLRNLLCLLVYEPK